MSQLINDERIKYSLSKAGDVKNYYINYKQSNSIANELKKLEKLSNKQIEKNF